jgi:hypothetical protein
MHAASAIGSAIRAIAIVFFTVISFLRAVGTETTATIAIELTGEDAGHCDSSIDSPPTSLSISAFELASCDAAEQTAGQDRDRRSGAPVRDQSRGTSPDSVVTPACAGHLAIPPASRRRCGVGCRPHRTDGWCRHIVVAPRRRHRQTRRVIAPGVAQGRPRLYGGMTVLPHRAAAKHDLRLVPCMTAADT